MAAALGEPPSLDDQAHIEVIMKHGHQDLVQAVAFNAYGDRCATGAVDGHVRVFNRHRDGMWRLCDTWRAHGGEILELQWLPPTMYPNLLASLGVEGHFKLWTEDPAAPPGRRFSRPEGMAKAAFETRSPRSSYRSFSMKHDDETRHTYLALLTADSTLTVLENDQPEALGQYTPVDEFRVGPKPPRGEEASFRVRFDPNPEPCYAALHAGVRQDALGLVAAAMDAVRIYRTRQVTTTSYGLQGTARAFYLAAEITGHHGLVRDVAWAPGNFRGYDILATACQDGYVRVVRIDTPPTDLSSPSWSAGSVLRRGGGSGSGSGGGGGGGSGSGRSHGHPSKKRDIPSSNTPSEGPAMSGAATPNAAFGGSVSSSLSSNRDPSVAIASGFASDPFATAVDDPELLLPNPTNMTTTMATTTTTTSATPTPSATSNLVLPGVSSNSNLAGVGSNVSSIPSSANTSFSSAIGGDGSGGLSTAATGGLSTVGSTSTLPLHGPNPASGTVDPHSTTTANDRHWTGAPGQVLHTVHELSKLENNRTPVWRVSFDDDGQILGSVGDDGKLMCYRQTPDGEWALSTELTVMKQRM